MYFKEDNTYQDMIKNSTMQWLEEVSQGKDLVNKHGAKLTKEYIQTLDRRVKELEEQITLRDNFLKRMKEKDRKNNRVGEIKSC